MTTNEMRNTTIREYIPITRTETRNTKQSPATYYKKMYEREIERHGETLQKLGATEYRLEQANKEMKRLRRELIQERNS